MAVKYLGIGKEQDGRLKEMADRNRRTKKDMFGFLVLFVSNYQKAYEVTLRKNLEWFVSLDEGSDRMVIKIDDSTYDLLSKLAGEQMRNLKNTADSIIDVMYFERIEFLKNVQCERDLNQSKQVVAVSWNDEMIVSPDFK